MGIVDQIFGAPLDAGDRERTAPQSADAVVSPRPVELAALDAEAPVETQPMMRLARFVMDAYRRNRDHRRNSGVDARLEYALMANRCRFSDEQLVALTKVGIPRSIAENLRTAITFVKSRGAKSILNDLLSQSGEPLFDLTYSPVPDVPMDATAETMQSMESELAAFIEGMERAGVTHLSPEADAKLQEAVRVATADRYDEIANQKESMARTRIRRMKNKVWDMMEEGGFSTAVHECISDLCVSGTCVLHGPVMRAVECNVVKQTGQAKMPRYVREVRLKPVFERISPFDCYPAPDVKDTADGPFCIRVKFAAHDLWTMCDRGAFKEKNGEGWNDAVVRDILERHPWGGVKLDVYSDGGDALRRELENHGRADDGDCMFEGVRCYAHVRGASLAEMGIVRRRDNKPILLDDFYRVEAVVIDGKTVYCRILDDRMEVPISHCSFYEVPGSWWGESVADKLRLVQTMQDNTAKALFLDLAGTGPMFWVRNAGLLRDKSPEATMFRAYKTVLFDEPMFPQGGSSGVPMGTIDVPSRARELSLEWDMWNQQADNDSGIPRFAEGQSAGQSGALRTSSGLAQFNEHMMRGMKAVLMSFDNGMIRTAVRRMADWELIFGDDMSLKGDVYVMPVGLIGRIMRVQRDQARMQLFNMIVTNQFLLQLIGPGGVMALLRPSLKDLDVNPDDILPDEQRVKFMAALEELKQLAMAEAQAAQGAEAQAPQEQGMGAGAPPGVAQPPQVEMPQGGVEERRAVA